MESEEHLAKLRTYLSGVTSDLRVQHASLREGRRTSSTDHLPLPEASSHEAGHFRTAVITHNEVNLQHGTGVLLKRLIPDDSSVLHLRSNFLYGGNDFGSREVLLSAWKSRFELYRELLEELGSSTIETVFCVPFSSDDLELAMAVSEFCQAPLGIYIMDDQNLSSGKIDDVTMRTSLEKASVRFAISDEMLRAYENKFGRKFYFLPPVVEERLLVDSVGQPKLSAGIMLGNIWAPEWLEEVRKCVRESGTKIDWYGNHNGLASFNEEALAEDGIVYRGVISEEALATKLRDYPFTLLLSEPEKQESTHWLARFSLPTRLITCIATGNLPVIVVGAPDSAAAAFVRNHGLGIICPYEGGALKEAVTEILNPPSQEKFRLRAATLAPSLSNSEIQGWIMTAVTEGFPPDNRFESIRSSRNESLSPWIGPEPPSWLDYFETEVWRVLARIKGAGHRMDFVIDVGASNGIFSRLVHKTLELDDMKTRMILVEPLLETYRKLNSWYLEQIPNAECVVSALSDSSGEMVIQVTDDLYDSSITSLVPATSTPVTVPVTTLDELAHEKKIEGRGLLKIDVQGAECLVLEGAASFLEQVDFVMLETNLAPPDESIPDFTKIVALMNDRGFRLFDHSGGWRNPDDGVMIQLDAWFIRRDYSGTEANSESLTADKNAS